MLNFSYGTPKPSCVKTIPGDNDMNNVNNIPKPHNITELEKSVHTIDQKDNIKVKHEENQSSDESSNSYHSSSDNELSNTSSIDLSKPQDDTSHLSIKKENKDKNKNKIISNNNIMIDKKDLNLKKNIKISSNEAMEAILLSQEIRSNYLLLPLPILFLILYLVVILTHCTSSTLFKVENALKDTLVPSGDDIITDNSEKLFLNIGNIEECFEWINNTFIPSVFVTTDYNGNSLDEKDYGRIALFNRVLGAVQFTTTQVTRENCNVETTLNHIYPECYNMNNISQRVVYIDSDSNSADALTIINNFKTIDKHWLDSTTKELLITVGTYNGELRVFTVTKLIISFERGGFVKPTYHISAIPAKPYESIIIYFMDLMFFITFLFMFITEIREFVYYIRLRKINIYFNDFWNLVDWLAISMIFITSIIWIQLAQSISNTNFTSNLAQLTGFQYDIKTNENAQKRLDETIGSLVYMSEMMTILRIVGTLTSVILSLRILKHFRFQPKLAILSNTVARSLREFGPFFFVFIIIFSSFVVAGILLFGEQIESFSTIGYAIVTCINLLFGSYDITEIINMNYTLGIIFYWSYMITHFLILLNMLLAIVLDSYEVVKKRAKLKHKKTILNEIKQVFADDFIHLRKLYHFIIKKEKKTSKISQTQLLNEIKNGIFLNKNEISAEMLMDVFNVNEDVAVKKIINLRTFSKTNTLSTASNLYRLENKKENNKIKIINSNINNTKHDNDKDTDHDNDDNSFKDTKRINEKKKKSKNMDCNEIKQLQERMINIEKKIDLLLMSKQNV